MDSASAAPSSQARPTGSLEALFTALSEARSAKDEGRVTACTLEALRIAPQNLEVLTALGILAARQEQPQTLRQARMLLSQLAPRHPFALLLRSLERLLQLKQTGELLSRAGGVRTLVLGDFSLEMLFAIASSFPEEDLLVLPLTGAKRRWPTHLRLEVAEILPWLELLKAQPFHFVVVPFDGTFQEPTSPLVLGTPLAPRARLIFEEGEGVRGESGLAYATVDTTHWEHVGVSLTRMLRHDGGASDRRILSRWLETVLSHGTTFAVCGPLSLIQSLLEQDPSLLERLKYRIASPFDRYRKTEQVTLALDLKEISLDAIPDEVDTVLITETRCRRIARLSAQMPLHVAVVTLEHLARSAMPLLPNEAFVPKVTSIYPVRLPEIAFKRGQDLILMDLPARSLGQMPAGFAYVHTALERTSIQFQTLDLDQIVYHRFHSDRILDLEGERFTAKGARIPEDPWLPVHYLRWEEDDFLEFFAEDIDEIVQGLIEARPKIIGFSLQQSSVRFTKEVVKRVTAVLKDVIVLVGGMSLLRPEALEVTFSEAHYAVIGEADLIVGPLVEALAQGKRPFDLPGVISRFDTPGRAFVPGPLPTNLDALPSPRYPFADLSLYREWNGKTLTPIIGSRGCRWSRCRFCAERFHWRSRTPERVVDDLEFFAQRGFDNFVFNESDLHGDPSLTLRMCQEIIRRGLDIRMTAQLRCHPKTDRAYFDTLYAAGFRYLRFGVDGWSAHTLKLECKGYSKRMVRENLRDAAQAGICVATNLVIGIPGETDADVEESIAFLIELKPFIGVVESIQPLMLFRGSDYWDRPEEFGIKFRRDRGMLYRRYAVSLPDSEWYSEPPYIDAAVRYERFERIVTALEANGIPIAPFARFTDEEVKKKVQAIPGVLETESRGSRATPATCKPLATEIYRGHRMKVIGEGAVGVLEQSRANLETLSSGMPGVLRASDGERLRLLVDTLGGLRREGTPLLLTGRGESFYGLPLLHAWEQQAPDISPRLLRTYRSHNLVRYQDRLYAAPLSAGPLDLTLEATRSRPDILSGSDPLELELAIDCLMEDGAVDG